MSEPCSKCKRTNTLKKYGRTFWYKDKEGKRLCRWCYLRLIANPKKRFHGMKFMGKTTIYPFKIRIGQCFIVGCVSTRTDRHHICYIKCFPTAMTVELCDAHHREENAKQESQQHEYYFDWNRTIVPLPLSK